MNIKQISLRLLLTIVAIITFQLSYAQQNYSMGYVVTNEGDTLLGSIDYDYWKNSPENISFRNSGGIETIYGPGDIRAFSVENIIYVSATTELEVSPKRAAALPDTPELLLKTRDVFLLTLISGSKSLYIYSKEMFNDNFYIKQDGEYKLLKYKKYQKQENGQRIEGEIQKYLGQLILYLEDCDEIQKILDDTRYSQKSLMNVFKDYYTCINETATGYKKPRKSELQFGPMIGATITSLSFKGRHPFLPEIEFTDSKNLAAGAFLEIILNKNKRLWSVFNELLYTSYSFNTIYLELENGPYYSDNYINISYSYMNLNSLLRYLFKFNKTAVFANAGFSLGIPVTQINENIIKSNFQTTEKNRTEKAVEPTRRRDLSFIAGIGTEFKNVGLQFRYEAGRGISKRTNLKSPTSSFALLLTYGF